MIAAEHVYVDAAGRIVPGDDPAAAFLLAAPGDEYDAPGAPDVEVAAPSEVETADAAPDEVKVPAETKPKGGRGHTKAAPAPDPDSVAADHDGDIADAEAADAG